MISLLPTELWSLILWNACLDSGYTGCSISYTCRYFYNVSKPLRLRSVAIKDISQAISFLNMIERLPPNQRVVENLYLSLQDQVTGEFGSSTEIMAGLMRIYSGNPPSDPLLALTETEILWRIGRVYGYLVLRILSTVASDLKYLYTTFPPVVDMTSCHLLPLRFPVLDELVFPGVRSNNWSASPSDIGCSFPVLRRLRLLAPYTRIWADLPMEHIPVYAPHLTHLRVDLWNAGSMSGFLSSIRKLLKFQFTPPGPSPGSGSAYASPPVVGMHGLEKLLIHPGILPVGSERSYISPAATLDYRRSCDALAQVAMADSRIFLFGFRSSAPECANTVLVDEWLDRITGHLSYWEEKNKYVPRS